MRILLKIMFAPIVAALAIVVWLCASLLSLSSWVFGLLGTVFSILGLIILLVENVTNGIIVLIFAVLVSPFGLPMAVVWLIGQIQKLRYFVQDKVYG